MLIKLKTVKNIDVEKTSQDDELMQNPGETMDEEPPTPRTILSPPALDHPDDSDKPISRTKLSNRLRHPAVLGINPRSKITKSRSTKRDLTRLASLRSNSKS